MFVFDSKIIQLSKLCKNIDFYIVVCDRRADEQPENQEHRQAAQQQRKDAEPEAQAEAFTKMILAGSN